MMTDFAFTRRDMLRTAMAAGAAAGAGVVTGFATPAVADSEPATAGVAEVYRLQAAFHRAKSTQDIDLMMSLWAVEATLDVQGNPSSPFVGAAELRSFWLSSGSFTHRRLSLVPSFKTQIDLTGNRGWLYFECHDVGDYDLSVRSIVVDTFLAGTIRMVNGTWVFSDMTAGRAFPLSVDHYYFP